MKDEMMEMTAEGVMLYGMNGEILLTDFGDCRQLAEDLDMNLSRLTNDPEGFEFDLVQFDDYGVRIAAFNSFNEVRAFLMGYAIHKVKSDQAAEANSARGK